MADNPAVPPVIDASAPIAPGGTHVQRRWRRRALGGVLAVAALVGALVAGSRIGRHDVRALTPRDVSRTAATVVADALKKRDAQPARAAQVYRTVAPSLVVITTGEASTDTLPVGAPEGGDASTDRVGLGAGVVVNQQGAILTANHVVSGAARIMVTFADGTRAEATVAQADPANDTAVLITETKPEVIVPAVLGGGAQVGDDVFAVGHPLGLTFSLSAGVVSGLERTVPIDASTTLKGLIQFDAAVNPGNSGGPLLNRDGQVVGIVTALANPAKQNFFAGIGFAVPIATAGGAAGGPPQ